MLTLTTMLAVEILNPTTPPSAKMGEAMCRATVGYQYWYPTVTKYDNEQAIDTDVGTRK